jgi:molybdopterin synthase catalytic subunit
LISIQIVHEPIIYSQSEKKRKEDGSELLFNGRVRSKEGNALIKGLEYEQYEGMAESELFEIGNESLKKFPINDLICKHRIGKVMVGETSLHVVIWSKHRKEGFEAMSYFISELKKRVPIWKWAILEDGTKIPSECSHY